MSFRPAGPWLLPLLGLLAPAAPGRGARPDALPPIVFVSRAPVADRGVIPGLGPAGRTLAPGGRLLLREPDGAIRELLPKGAMWDVSDPSVSFDSRTIVFAGVEAPDRAWRLYRVGVDGKNFAALPVPSSAARVDDFDPCWIGPAALVFASTRYPRRAQYAPVPVTNLFRLDLESARLSRLTSERNGAEEPCWDPRTKRVLFSRWWFNRHHPADSGGLRVVRAGEPDAEVANLWHVMSIAPEGGEPRLEAGRMEERITAMAYQPAALPDGDVAGVFAIVPGLYPRGGAYGIQRLDRSGRHAERIAGAAREVAGAAGYGGTAGLAPTSACAPAALPDGRIVFSFDPGGRGDFGLAIADGHGGGRTLLVDLPGTLELDAAPVVRRSAAREAAAPRPLAAFPARDVAELLAPAGTFRYRNVNVFGGHGAPPRVEGARIRFFATLDRPAAEGGDTVVLVRERPVSKRGRVDESGLPADVPMFEQLIDAHGNTLRGPLGPAHVLGLNTGAAGLTLECEGCHVGHSRLRR